MKKLILLLALAFVMCGCVPTNEDGSVKLNTGNFNSPQVVVIDSCEYIKWTYGIAHRTYGLAHKGNCKYCQKRLENTIDSIIKNNK